MVKLVIRWSLLCIAMLALSGCAGWRSSAGITTNEGPRGEDTMSR